MAFPEQLIEQARHLATRERKRPRQASLRRAVSTAYYALFHLLVSEASANWRRSEQRQLFARLFEHGRMKTASNELRAECGRILNSPDGSRGDAELDSIRHLKTVAETFSEAQQERHRADYDNSVQWMRTDVLGLIGDIEAAFASWRAVRNEQKAQDYLLSLLGRPYGQR